MLWKKLRNVHAADVNYQRVSFFGGYCKECKRAMNREYTQRKAKLRRVGNPKLAEFTPRELMEELRFRGYRGELTFEQKIKI